MKELKKKKKMTIDTLAIMVASGFDRVDRDFTEVKQDIKNIRRDILNLGDRFVSYHMFDSLSSRVKVLEEKKK